jgi:hypothetical protein
VCPATAGVTPRRLGASRPPRIIRAVCHGSIGVGQRSAGYTTGPATGEAIGGTASDGRSAQLGVNSGDTASIYGARESEVVQKMERIGGGPLASAINICAGKGLDAAIADSRNTDLARRDR